MVSKADTHIHTTCSDGKASPAELVDYVVEQTDLRVIAVTDHDTAEGALMAREYTLRRGLDIDVIIGQEVTTDEGDVVGLFVQATLPAFRTARAAIQAIHAQGGLAVAVHPFSTWLTFGNMHGLGRQITTLPLDAVEVRNGFPTNFIGNRLTLWYNRRRARPLSELGGSDSHLPYTVGQAFTLFPGRSAADFRQALIDGATRAAGPLWQPASVARSIPVLFKRGLPGRASEPVYADRPARQPGLAIDPGQKIPS